MYLPGSRSLIPAGEANRLLWLQILWRSPPLLSISCLDTNIRPSHSPGEYPTGHCNTRTQIEYPVQGDTVGFQKPREFTFCYNSFQVARGQSSCAYGVGVGDGWCVRRYSIVQAVCEDCLREGHHYGPSKILAEDQKRHGDWYLRYR